MSIIKTQPVRKLREKYAKDDVLTDSICSLLISIGVLLALRQLFRFDNPLIYILLRSTIVIGVTALVTRRWWSTALFLFVFAYIVFVAVTIVHGRGSFWDYIYGFANWWIHLFPSSSQYNTPSNVTLVLWIITISVCISVFFLVRCIHSFYLFAVLTGVLFTVIYVNGFCENLGALALIVSGSVPMLARGFHSSLIVRIDEVFVSKKRAVAAGMAICILSTLMAFQIVPVDTTGWKNPQLAEIYNRIKDSQSELSQTPYNLNSLGLQPNHDKLGGDIELDHKLVLIVETKQPAPMKGKIYGHYTGAGWKEDSAAAFQFDSFSKELADAFCLNLPLKQEGVNPLWDIMPETQTRVSMVYGGYALYSSGRVSRLSAQSRNHTFYFRDNSELYSVKRMPTRFKYSFISTFFNRRGKNLDYRINEIEKQSSQKNSSSYDFQYDSIAKKYLQLPENIPESVYRTAAKVSGSNTSAYEKMIKIERYLQSNFKYTLKPGDVPAGEDFVAYFLKTGQGYCTYYASAMAVMARTLDVPSRFVIGYGLVPDGRSYAAYTDNAHAWVECYIRGVGWVTFDPTSGSSYTPPVAIQATNLLPQTTVENPEETTAYQGDKAKATTTTTPNVKSLSKPARTSPNPKSLGDSILWLVLIPIILVFLGIAAVILRVLRLRNAYKLDTVKARFGHNSACIDYYYNDLLRQLNILKLSPDTGETILQHGGRVRMVLNDENTEPKSGDGDRLINTFHTVMNWRYGRIPPSDLELKRIAEVHDLLENRLRSTLSPLQYFIRRYLFA